MFPMCRGARCVPGLCHEPCQGVPGAGSWGFPGAPEPCSGLWCVPWGWHPRHDPYGINVHRPCCGARLCPWHDAGAHVFPVQTPKQGKGQGQGEKKKRDPSSSPIQAKFAPLLTSTTGSHRLWSCEFKSPHRPCSVRFSPAPLALPV